MRVKSEIFVAALIRRVFSAGGFAAVEKRGADEAGAIFIRQRFRDGRESLYAPAPQLLFRDDDDGQRRFEARLEAAEPEQVDAIVAREQRFDSDLWLLEIEIDDVSGLIDLARS